MTVLMTADAMGGVWTYALDLARALGRRGIAVALAVMGDPPSRSQARDAAAIPTLCLLHRAFRLEWMADPWDDVAAAGEWLLDLEKTCDADVVHLNGYAHGALPFESPVLVVAHSCVLSWWHGVHGEAAPECWNAYRKAVRLGLAGARLIVAPTRYMASCIERWYGPSTPVRVVPNGRNASPYTPGTKRPIVLSAGRLWDEAKNVAALVEAAPHLAWPVCVAGEAASSLPGMTCLGRLGTRQLARWYTRAAIYASPARYEPFGLSALEAAFSGCALVLGDIPSLREVWGAAACYVEPDDSTALAASITALIDRTDQRASMAARAMTRARRYTLDAACDAYLTIYQELTGMRSQPAGMSECA